MTVLSLVESVRQALEEEMAADPSGHRPGRGRRRPRRRVPRHGRPVRSSFGDNRVIDTPLAELGIAGVAIGAAMNGLRPVAEIQFADYIHPAYDQIVNEAAKIRYRSNGTFGCPVVFRAPFGAGVHGGLYHSQSVEALFFHVPGLKIVVPSTPYDCKGLLKSSIRDDDPVLFFEHKKSYRRLRGEVPDDDYVIPLGKADLKRPGQRPEHHHVRHRRPPGARGQRALERRWHRHRDSRPAHAAAARHRRHQRDGRQDQ